MSETRDTFEYDSFGQILFMNEDFKKSKFRLSCIVDACIPPDMGKTKIYLLTWISRYELILGVWSCDVESACAGRYDDVYKMFMNEPNDVTPLRKRREAEEPKIEEGSLMIFSVSHFKLHIMVF